MKTKKKANQVKKELVSAVEYISLNEDRRFQLQRRLMELAYKNRENPPSKFIENVTELILKDYIEKSLVRNELENIGMSDYKVLVNISCLVQG